jgi:hypothetical protein
MVATTENTTERMQAAIDDENDRIREQVQAELPYPKGGFETDEELQQWKDRTEARFMALVMGEDKV